ncbi:hypothetical protein DNTS_028428 [Danionella cerebrum]|uniref:Uncharacterized protein n=1 Tax=Danionella cerebrum TaxID=2873325 RepID=A0A553NW60_9TELE|nr:hypothetical protein DNTS_028428 [Danionella translucida]
MVLLKRSLSPDSGLILHARASSQHLILLSRLLLREKPGLTLFNQGVPNKGWVMGKETPPQYYSSRQTLVSSSEGEQMNHHTGLENISAETSSLFLIGVPSSYYLPPLEPRFPRLPSYESVRKKDRQRQIHMMIAHRFGLHTSIPDESTSASEAPPTYEESVRQSIQSIDVPFDILTSPEPEAGTDDLPPYDSLHPRTDSSEHSNGGS